MAQAQRAHAIDPPSGPARTCLHPSTATCAHTGARRVCVGGGTGQVPAGDVEAAADPGRERVLWLHVRGGAPLELETQSLRFRDVVFLAASSFAAAAAGP